MIGIFDSGLGGLTVARAVMDELAGYDILYFGDTARTPYGAKSPETVIKYALENTELLLSHGAKMVIMACNTASSVATEAVTARFDIPVFEVITPAVALAARLSKTGAIGVIGTRATINSGIYEKKILEQRPGARVHSQACPLLVPLVEEGWLKKPETAMIVKKYLHPLKTRQVDTLILGCTHYPILKKTIGHKIGRRVAIIDSSTAVARSVKAFIDGHPPMEASLSKTGTARFLVSDITAQFKTTAQLILSREVALEHVSL
ncbi:glutamate racemase [Desulfosudis oleivorans]|uniref:Glutamate racemase n=1 Tax=Desulfosudis oleivorans (strain DSM 6200 / JCM 39069 / Hxd3) TaxID=96561 RepID=A8ZU36_DESOH|nr:glutamate racemase [Desulfosudis oleivorans]ABW66348.1 glutamate racemase [Desulfosudis oleivorans Hxd3]